MKKTFIALCVAGSMFCAMAHGGGVGGFKTEDAGLVENRHLEITLTGNTDFIGTGHYGAGLGLVYGIGNRFQIGIDNSWSVHKDDLGDYAFDVPEISMKFAIIPQILAAKTFISPGAYRTVFGGLMAYSLNLPSETVFNFNTGFEVFQRTTPWKFEEGKWSTTGLGDGQVLYHSNDEAFTYSFSVIQNINHFFVGAELFGSAHKDMDDDAKKPEWQLGAGYDLLHTVVISLGFGGSFVSNDDLHLTLGFTFNIGGN
jgi:hypothetical protein